MEGGYCPSWMSCLQLGSASESPGEQEPKEQAGSSVPPSQGWTGGTGQVWDPNPGSCCSPILGCQVMNSRGFITLLGSQSSLHQALAALGKPHPHLTAKILTHPDLFSLKGKTMRLCCQGIFSKPPVPCPSLLGCGVARLCFQLPSVFGTLEMLPAEQGWIVPTFVPCEETPLPPPPPSPK